MLRGKRGKHCDSPTLVKLSASVWGKSREGSDRFSSSWLLNETFDVIFRSHYSRIQSRERSLKINSKNSDSELNLNKLETSGTLMLVKEKYQFWNESFTKLFTYPTNKQHHVPQLTTNSVILPFFSPSKDLKGFAFTQTLESQKYLTNFSYFKVVILSTTR
jgi:hypothetical protein